MADTDAGMANLAAAATYLKQQAGAGKLGVIGWCFGGAWSLEAALGLPGQVDAAVVYYGRVVTDRARLAALDAPLLGLFGERDRAIPASQVREMEALLGELGKDAEVVVYPGAGHAFANATRTAPSRRPTPGAAPPPSSPGTWGADAARPASRRGAGADVSLRRLRALHLERTRDRPRPTPDRSPAA